MKSYLKYLNIIAIAVLCVSCKKYLDVTPDNSGTIDYAFRNRNEAENYLFSCYSTLQQFNNIKENVGFVTSGEVFLPNNLPDPQGMAGSGFGIIYGTQIASEPKLNFWDGSEGGKLIFQAIRRCNTLLENIDKPIDLTVTEKERWIAEVKFLKAYYHYYLFRLYGPIPILDKNVAISGSIDDVRVKRAPVDSVVNYIVKLLDESAPQLPSIIQNQIQELGRITKPIALSVKAEVLMTAASPLFNGNTDYTGLRNADGQNLFSAQADKSKWDRASQACLEAINACEAVGMTTLHTFITQGNIPSNLAPELKKILDLQTAVTEEWRVNKDLIWALNAESGIGMQEYAMPRLTAGAVATNYAHGTLAVPISEQELFYTKNGLPIQEDKDWQFNDRFQFRTGDSENRFYIHEGYQTIKAHFDREPRFYAYVAFDGGVWYGNGNTATKLAQQENAPYVQDRGPDALAGPKQQNNTNVTGYWPKKLVNYLTTLDDPSNGWVNYRLPMMRLSGLYLLYAEALNEQTSRNETEAIRYINKVRSRAGIADLDVSWAQHAKNPTGYQGYQGLKKVIHQERRIELCFEGQAGWDLRRWKELQGEMARPLQGWNVYEPDPINYYRARTLLTPVFGLRNYLWPIKQRELLANPNLVQNPGW